ncbi:MAG TPA: hypothetical protein VJY33_22160, partial [Isosphaeraceae bacterium]|nr:hypothetical protein [Isosphaeraceae bacterium]
PTPRGDTEMMTAIRDSLIESAYYRDNDDLANQIVACDEQLSGVVPAEATQAELTLRLDYWLSLASRR